MKIDSVDDKLFISGSIDEYDLLMKYNIKSVINLKAESHDDINELTKRNIAYYWIPIPDWGAPRSAQIRLFNELLENTKEVVLVHCEVGMGRSVCLCVSYLMENKIVDTINKGIEYMNKVRHISKMWYTQLDKLRSIYE